MHNSSAYLILLKLLYINNIIIFKNIVIKKIKLIFIKLLFIIFFQQSNLKNNILKLNI